MRIALQERELNRTALLIMLLAGLYMLVFPDVSVAVPIGITNFNQAGAHSAFDTFVNTVSIHVNNLLTPGSAAYEFIQLEVVVFGSYRLAIAVGRYAMASTGDLTEIFQVTILILLVLAMISSYGMLTTLLYAWSNDLAGVIQMEVAGTNEVFFASTAVNNMLSAISFSTGGAVFLLFNPGAAAAGLALTLILAASVFALDIVVFIGLAWSVWGFALAKFLGWFFLPFLLIERLAPLFDGWLRFLISILFYGVIIRVNSVLIVLLIQSYFNLGTSVGPGLISIEPVTIEANTMADIGGLLGMCFVSILSIFATGRFSTAIVGGIGGFGESVGAIARAIGGAKLISKK